MSTGEISNWLGEAPAVLSEVSRNAARYSGFGEAHAHTVQFYSDENFLLESLGKLIGAALSRGRPAVVIATQEHLDGLAAGLGARGFDLAKCIERSQYIPCDAQQTLSRLMRNGRPDPELFNETIGGVLRRASAVGEEENVEIEAYGEMVALLWAEGNGEAAIQIEQLWNKLAREHRFSLRCAYPMWGFSEERHAEPFARICSEHTAVIPGEAYTVLADDEQRTRNVAVLQQKAEALETQKAFVGALQEAKEKLEKEIRERQEAEERVRASEISLRELSGRLLRTQDEERRRLGRELHDTVGQYLAALKMGLDVLASAGGVENVRQRHLAECLDLAKRCIQELRTMSYLLYPPMLEETGLKTAIAWFVEGFSRRSGINVAMDIDTELGRLPREVELAAFRIVQESLTNVHRHSGSRTATIRAHLNDTGLLLEVADAGKGFSDKPPDNSALGSANMGVGLRGMRERVCQLGGKLDVNSGANGTRVKALLPCRITADCYHFIPSE